MAHTLIVDDAGTVLVVDPPTDAAGQPILPAETGYAAVEVDDAEHAKFGQYATYTYADGVVTATPVPVDPPVLDPVQAIVQAVLSAKDCPPGVRAAIEAVQAQQSANG